MESIVKMGVRSVRDSRSGDSAQNGQFDGPESEQHAADPEALDGTDYSYDAGRIPGTEYSYGAGRIPGTDHSLGTGGISGAPYSSGVAAAPGAGAGAYGSAAGAASANRAGDGSPRAEKENEKSSEKAVDGKTAPQKSGGKKASDGDRTLMNSRKKHYRMIAQYVIATIVLSYVLIHIANNLGIVLKMTGKAAQTVGILLSPLFWGFVLAYILNPAVDFFDMRFKKRSRYGPNSPKSRGAAVAVTYVLTLLLVGVILSVVASAISKSLRLASIEDLVIMIESLAKTLKSFQNSIQNWFEKMNISSNEVSTALGEVGEWLANFTSRLSKSVAGVITHLGGILTSAIFVIIFSIYFLLDRDGLLHYWKRVVAAIGGKNAHRYCKIIVDDADAVFSGYIRGQLIDAFIMAILVSGSLYLIGVKYAVIIGILSGIGNLIPYVGPIVAYGSTILVCLVSGDWKRMIVALVVLFVIQTIDGNVINPRLLSSNIDVHPMLVIAALIIGGAVGGFVGMLFAVPVAAFLKIQFDKIIYRLLLIRMPEMAKEKKPEPEQRRGRKSAENSEDDSAAGDVKDGGKSAAKRSRTGDAKTIAQGFFKRSPKVDAKSSAAVSAGRSRKTRAKRNARGGTNDSAVSGAKRSLNDSAVSGAKRSLNDSAVSGAKRSLNDSAVSGAKKSSTDSAKKNVKTAAKDNTKPVKAETRRDRNS